MQLHTTYFGPIQWYQSLYRSDDVIIDGDERWQKQTIRNHCLIATANGVQKLTVPIIHGRNDGIDLKTPPSGGWEGSPATKDIRISNHGKWRREHWNALQSAYGESAFFDYYEDDIRPFFTEEWEYLFDYNLAIMNKMCELISPTPLHTPHSTLHTPHSTLHTPPSTPYYQVYQQKHGFIPNLSILDLLFNMGNEAILYLI